MSFLQLKNIKVHYPVRGGFFNTVIGHVYAVDGIDMVVEEGRTYGLIGESGSGKSTIGKVIVGLEKLTSGEITYRGKDIGTRAKMKALNYNKDVQMIFQDALSSLNPKKRVRDIIAEPLRNFEKLTPEEELSRIYEMLEIVGMPADSIYKYPHEFSGGQRQRIGIARAAVCKPKLIVADEPVSALDLSVQAQVLNYMKQIQRDFNLSYIFISHDLGVVKHMCDYIYIMNNGRFVEAGTRQDIYGNSKHVYTKMLIASIPEADPDMREISFRNRRAAEEEYKQRFSEFFTPDGKVYDLSNISDTHFAAVKGRL